MDAVLGEMKIGDPTATDPDMADILPQQSEKKNDKKDKKEKKKDKEEKKVKKRRHSDVNGDAEVGEKKKKKTKA